MTMYKGQNIFVRRFALTLVMLFPAVALDAQQTLNATTCSTHFQARANWLKGLKGQRETIAMMETYAELLWLSVPRDCGMFTGFYRTDCRYQSHDDAILAELTRWAEQGEGFAARPLCMEDRFCSRCTALVATVVR